MGVGGEEVPLFPSLAARDPTGWGYGVWQEPSQSQSPVPLVGDAEISSLQPLAALRFQGLRALSLRHHLHSYGRARVKGPIFHQPHQDTDIYFFLFFF